MIIYYETPEPLGCFLAYSDVSKLTQMSPTLFACFQANSDVSKLIIVSK